jgi:hypothetical protein
MPRARVRALVARAVVAAVPATALLASGAPAGGAAIERSVPSMSRILYEPGRYGEIGAAWVDPRQSGSGADLSLLGTPMVLDGRTGDMFDPEWSLSGAAKADLGPRLSVALVVDQPYGAATTYPGGASPVAALYAGTLARLDSWDVTGVAAWGVTPALKLYGGIRGEWLDARAEIPFIADYAVEGAGDWAVGYLVGVGYARPEIAFRAALTYLSAIRHRLATEETAAVGAETSTTEISTPQSVTFEIQSGIAPRTLAFGSVRWVEWSDFDIAPPLYGALVGEPLVDYSGDWWTWTAGVARQLTDALAGSLSLTYEPSIGGALTTLGPHDGRTTATAALSYDLGAANLTGGVTWGRLGDTANALDTEFDDGSVFGVGVRLGMRF